MKFSLFCFLTVVTVSMAFGADKIKMSFNNGEELIKIIELYSKESGQKFVVEPGVRGRISIFNQEPVSLEEAFNQLSSALAINGFAMSKQGDTMVVKSARAIRNDLIDVSTELPALKPERMAVWVVSFKHISALRVIREMKGLVTRDGEANVNEPANQMIITDWVSNLHKVAELFKQIDKPVDKETAKLVEAAKKEAEARQKKEMKKEREMGAKKEAAPKNE